MTIHRDRGDIVIECDVGTCPNTFTLNDSDFHLTWNAAKRDGWETKKIAGEWLHACPGCIL